MSGNASSDMIAKCLSSLLVLRDYQGAGAGFSVDADSHILTCNHVVSSENVIIETIDGESYDAEVYARKPEYDLAILKVQGYQTSPLRFADPSSIRDGQRVYLLGHPVGLDFTVTEGIVGRKQRVREGVTYVQLDVAANPGNSGGPVVNESGDVLGVVTIMLAHAQRLSFAIGARHVFAFLSMLRIRVNRADRFSLNEINHTQGVDH